MSSLVERLATAGCVAPEEEASELLAWAARGGDLEAGVRRREQGEPLAWIVGGVDFCGIRLGVDPGVFVPRHQTERLAREGVALLRGAPGRVVDLCAGSGAVAAVMARAVPGATVVAVDRDPLAVANARHNGLTAVCGDLDGPLRPGTAALVTAVAPYVPTGELVHLPSDVVRWEPRMALDGGADGLDVAREVCAAAARLLVPGGWLLLELGGDQDALLRSDLAVAFGERRSWRDEHGDLRGLAARRR